mmetsp:Transcript_103955/g.199508  ORF Transcript_103955/g.199508 Transcript_103955/m.199508 type:complete len:289 (-) Transcript_103955:151-1017(-)
MLLLLHFLLTTCRTIIVFYFSVKSYLVANVTWQLLHRETSEKPAGMSYGQYFDCTALESASLVKRFSNWTSNFEGECIGVVSNQLYGLQVPDALVLTLLNLIGLFIVLVFVLVLIYELAMAKPRHLGDGKYIALTFRLPKNSVYKVMTVVLTLYVTVLLLDSLRFAYFCTMVHGLSFTKSYIEKNLPTIAGLVYSAASLISHDKDPMFDVESEAFKKLQFNRNLTDALQPNTTFVKNVESAILEAKYGQNKELEVFREKKYACQTVGSPVDEILAACVPKDVSKKGLE